jgi:cholesterol oxidase
MPDVDVVIIGSGFGGAVTACRLAEAGYTVTVLERGRQWTVGDFPRKPDDAWTFDVDDPAKRHGWFDFRVFPNMTVVAGAGVGGGSLVYANIFIPAKKETFDAGWPTEITFDGLGPHYARAGQMLGVEPVPDTQWPERTKLMKEAADRMGWSGRFEPLELAVRFDKTWHYGLADPHSLAHAKMAPNDHGLEQGTCVHLGTCDIGCEAKARNTLDFNYLARATALGATIEPLALARTVAPEAGGYRVHVQRIDNGTLKADSVSGRLVILAAGSLGSTEILLRSRDEAQTLTNLSARLGQGWSSNGDFLTPAIHLLRKVEPSRGPTITSAINLLDGVEGGHEMFIEDGGIPDLIRAQIDASVHAGGIDANPLLRFLGGLSQAMAAGGGGLAHVMPWFAQARDAADGVMSLRNGRLFLDWDIEASEPTMEAVADMHRRLAFKTGGVPLTSPAWVFSKDLITPHPLGGCNMGTSAADGVVSHMGEVFGHPNLFVADGAIVPKAIGLNPSRTIAALAERIAEQIVQQDR